MEFANIRIEWAHNLLGVVRAHLMCAEDPQSPSIPPVYNSQENIYDFLLDNRATIAQLLAEQGFGTDLVDCCSSFIIEVLEQACGLSFLLPRERRLVITAALHKEKDHHSGPRVKVHGNRKRRTDEDAGVGVEHARVSRVLPLEYLLRLYIALPQILDHYDRLGGSGVPDFSKRPLWAFVNATLKLLEASKNKFVSLDAYVPLR